MITLYFPTQRAAYEYTEQKGLVHSGVIPNPPGTFSVTYVTEIVANGTPFVLTINKGIQNGN